VQHDDKKPVDDQGAAGPEPGRAAPRDRPSWKSPHPRKAATRGSKRALRAARAAASAASRAALRLSARTSKGTTRLATRASLRTARLAGQVLARATLVLGWCAALVLVVGTFIDRTELFERGVVHLLRSRLGALAGEVHLVDADVEWLERTLVLRGLTLDLGRREVFVDTLRLRFGLRDGLLGGPLALERAECLGGQVILSRAMLTALEQRARSKTPEAGVAPAALPTLYVRDLDLALETPDHGDIELGRASLLLREEAHGAQQLTGRFIPSFERQRNGEGEIWIVGDRDENGVLEARGTARALRIMADELPSGEPFDALRPFAPEFRVAFEGHGRLAPGASVLPELDLALFIADGRLELPHIANPAARPLSDVNIRATAAFRPEGPTSLWSPSAWRISSTLDAVWESTRVAATLRFGESEDRPTLAEASLIARDLELGSALLELGGHTEDLTEVHEMLGPDGRADVVLGLRFPRGWQPEDGIVRVEQAVAVVPRGEASIAYHGAISRRTGLRNEGFPLRVRGLRGLVTWTYHPADEYPVQLGLHTLEGRHAGGAVHVIGSLHEIPGHMIGDSLEERRERRPFFPSLFHLRIQSDGLPVDDELRAGFAGLAGVEPVGEIFDTFGPEGGRLSFNLELWRAPGRPELATDISIDVDDVAFTWRDLPVPLERVDGLLLVRSDGRGPEVGRTLVSIDARGESEVAHDGVRIVGRSQTEGRAHRAAAFAIDARRVNSRSARLHEVLLEKQPAIAAALETAGVAGFVDVSVVTREELAAEASTVWATTETRADGGVRLLPAPFPTPTEAVHGRVHVTTKPLAQPAGAEPLEPGRGPSRSTASGRATVQARWTNPTSPVALAAEIEFEDGSGPVLLVAGAGLDITDKGVLGSVADVVRAKGGSGDPLDPDKLDIDGRFDFRARFELPAEAGGPAGKSQLEVEARLDRLGFDGRQLLSDVNAHFRLVEETGEWIGERIAAEIGKTPVRLTDLRWTPSEGGSRLTANFAADNLPLDREHLQLFLDRETLARLLEDLALTGTVDIVDSQIRFERRADGVDALRFDGTLDVDEMSVILGVPLELQAVDGVDFRLALEGERLRARGSVRGLVGRLAGRQIDAARMELSYIHPRLSIDALVGRFEGGHIRPLGTEGAQFFAMDLAPPFPFELGARFSNVDVGGFLRGAFNSDFANEGRMNLDVRLAGDIEHLTGIRGDGRMEVDETRLWAVPVFQALFARLGFPTTAVFSRIATDFRVVDGTLHFERLRADSDLLSVVGSGSLDFEGDLSTDLEVRYGLIDRLGPFTRLLYKIQNSLLRVAVRGTMERPTVLLRGLISQFFRPAEDRDRLPLPSFSDLPPRF